MKKIIFTGGGSAGHVIPNLAIMQELSNTGKYELYYIGTGGIEKNIVSSIGVPFYEISTPKLVRKFSFSNFAIPFKFSKAVKSSSKIIKAISPDLIFSKGGFVSLPVVFAGSKLNIPCITHESDYSLGLANKLMAKKCVSVLTSFPETAERVKNGKYIGSPIKKSLFSCSRLSALSHYGFNTEKPVLLVFGGGSGSTEINSLIRKNIFSLSNSFQILHVCGKGNLVSANVKGYHQIEYESEMNKAYAVADVVVSRAGSNTVFEILALKKPALLLPLKASSRGDQIQNANRFAQKGLVRIYSPNTNFVNSVRSLLYDDELKTNLANSNYQSGNENIIREIGRVIK